MKSYGIGFLIDLLNISSTQMAQYINVDRSLVSKWKNGVRKLDVNAVYFDKVLDFFIYKNKELGLNNLEGIFSSIYKYENNDINSNKYLKKCLKRFILNNDVADKNSNLIDFQESTYITTIPIYEGVESNRKAILKLLEVAEKEENPCNLTFVFCGVLDALMEEDSFKNNWFSRVVKLLDRGFKLDFIYSLYNDSKLFTSLWQLILHKNCKILSFSLNLDNKYNFMIQIIQNKMVLFGSNQTFVKEVNSYCSIYTDPISVTLYSNFAKNFKKDSQNVFIAIDESFIEKFESRVQDYFEEEKYIVKHNNIYCYNDIPSAILMEDNLFLEILKQSLDSTDQIQKEFLKFKLRKDSFYKALENYKIICFYSIDELLRISNQEIISYERKIIINNTPIKVLRSQFKSQMQYISEILLNNTNFNICLYKNKIISNVPSIHVWCQKNNNIYIFDDENLLEPKYSKNVSFVNSISRMFEEQYLYTFDEYRSKQAVSEFLKNL